MGASSKWLVIAPSQGADRSSTLLAPTIAKKRLSYQVEAYMTVYKSVSKNER